MAKISHKSNKWTVDVVMRMDNTTSKPPLGNWDRKMLFFAPGGGNFYASLVFLCTMYIYISMKAKNKLPTYANIN